MTCKKAQGFLGAAEIDVAERIDATRRRIGREQALLLLQGMKTLIVAKGKKLVTLDLVKDRPDDATLITHLLGPTGNLRAPTAKIGTTVIVGYNEEAYRRVLGET